MHILRSTNTHKDERKTFQVITENSCPFTIFSVVMTTRGR